MVARALENTGMAPTSAHVRCWRVHPPVNNISPPPAQLRSSSRDMRVISTRVLDLSLDENIEGDVANFEMPLTPQQVVSLASPFIASLNGGPPLIPSGGFTNPLDLLNFALVLEYLESAFYNINVPNLKRALAK